ncbi:AAA family ATPase [Nonomuraea sp. NPDC003214]
MVASVLPSAVAGGVGWERLRAIAEEETSSLEKASWIAGILGPPIAIIVFVLEGRRAAKSREAEETRRRLVPPPVGPADLAPVETVAEKTRLLNRKSERATLRARLLGERGGVVIVSGERGVGKSRLVKAVLDALKKRPWIRARPRIIEHEAPPDRNVYLRVLTGDLDGLLDDEMSSWDRPLVGASELDKFKATLEALGKRRVVIAIERAEHLLYPDTHEFLNPELDQAFETLATTSGHRVIVILVTRTVPRTASPRTWLATCTALVVGGLPAKDFTGYLGELDKKCGHGLAGALAGCHEQFRGNPRLAELAHAILELPEYDVNRLTRTLAGVRPDYVSRVLVRDLVKGLGLTARRILEALDAFGTAIDAAAVCEVLKDKYAEDELKAGLATLVDKRLAHRTPDGRYYLPPSDASWLCEGTPEDRLSDAQQSDLLNLAATHLWNHRVRPVGAIEDLHFDFAALRAYGRANLQVYAYPPLLEELEAELENWNCGFLLIEHRKALREQLVEPEESVRNNENSLGHLYASKGDFDAAVKAYDNAARHADALQDLPNRIKIQVNLAGAYQWHNDMDFAYLHYAEARDHCDELIRSDPEQYNDLRAVRVGALEGMADCQRHWGLYDEALQLARTALCEPLNPAFPDTAEERDAATRRIGLAMKAARWHTELGEHENAQDHEETARLYASDSKQKWLWATYMAALAEIHVLRGDFTDAIPAANLVLDDAMEYRDPLLLLRARTSLCCAYLLKDGPDPAEASRQIESAVRYRRPGGPLIVPALHALVSVATQKQGHDSDEAVAFFRKLFEETEKRITHDDQDVTAWLYNGFASCGLPGPNGPENAIEAFRTAHGKISQPVPKRIAQLIRMIELLDQHSRPPGRLTRVVHTLQSLGARPADN